jgi:hypothetical protein
MFFRGGVDAKAEDVACLTARATARGVLRVPPFQLQEGWGTPGCGDLPSLISRFLGTRQAFSQGKSLRQGTFLGALESNSAWG